MGNTRSEDLDGLNYWSPGILRPGAADKKAGASSNPPPGLDSRDYTYLFSGGVKHDKGKPRAMLMLKDFRRALLAVAEVSTFGEKKYGKPSGWQSLEGCTFEEMGERYSDALARHILAEGDDPESGLPHEWHAAWNALAIIELKLMGAENG